MKPLPEKPPLKKKKSLIFAFSSAFDPSSYFGSGLAPAFQGALPEGKVWPEVTYGA